MSLSITGRFRCAAAISGWIEFPPPISSDMIPRNSWPMWPSINSTARAMVRLSVRRSWPTSGAPMFDTAATQSSSASSDAGMSCTRWPSL